MSPRATAAAPVPTAAPTTIASTLAEIALAEITESPLNPRTTQSPLEPDFVESIRVDGVTTAILLRPATGVEPGIKFEIVAGERRVRASRACGRLTIPAQVRAVDDLAFMRLALSENDKRRPLSPLDEAAALARVQAMDPIYKNLGALRSFVGHSESYLRDRLKLNRIVPVVRAALVGGAITAKHAEQIGTLPGEQQLRALEACFQPMLVDSSTPAKLIEAQDWDALAPAVCNTREHAEWCRDHGKADLGDVEVQARLLDELRDGITAERGPQEHGPNQRPIEVEVFASLLQLSTDAHLPKDERRALGIIGANDYKILTREKDRCPHAAKGAYVHGSEFHASADDGGYDGRITLVDVCVNKRACAKHWPKAAPAPAPSAKDLKATEAATRLREQAEADRKAWETDQPKYAKALGQLAVKKKVAVMDVMRAHFGAEQVRVVSSRFGVPVTEKTATVVFALMGTSTWQRDQFLRCAKERLGITQKQLDATVAKAAPKTAKSAKTRTKAGR